MLFNNGRQEVVVNEEVQNRYQLGWKIHTIRRKRKFQAVPYESFPLQNSWREGLLVEEILYGKAHSAENMLRRLSAHAAISVEVINELRIPY